MTRSVSVRCTALTTFIFSFFFFNATATTEIYTLSLHDALPIYIVAVPRRADGHGRRGARIPPHQAPPRAGSDEGQGGLCGEVRGVPPPRRAGGHEPERRARLSTALGPALVQHRGGDGTPGHRGRVRQG